MAPRGSKRSAQSPPVSSVEPVSDADADAEDRAERALKRRRQRADVSSDDDAPMASASSADDVRLLGVVRLASAPAAVAPAPISSDTVTLSSAPPLAVQPCAFASSSVMPVAAPAALLPAEREFRLRLQLWNIQDLGGGPSQRGHARNAAVIAAIARILHAGDAEVTTILEVKRSGRSFSSEATPIQRLPSLDVRPYWLACRLAHENLSTWVSDFRRAWPADPPWQRMEANRYPIESVRAQRAWEANAPRLVAIGALREKIKAARSAAPLADRPSAEQVDAFDGTDDKPGQVELWLQYWDGHDAVHRAPPEDWGFDRSDRSPPAATQASASSSSSSSASAADSAENHYGFREVQRIVQALDLIAGVGVYRMYPTLEAVIAKPDDFYTFGESYAFVYRADRVSPRAFAWAPGFDGRAPGCATFVRGSAEFDVIAHHFPAEKSSYARSSLRGHDLAALIRYLQGLRNRSRLAFYLGDTNMDTRGRMSEEIGFCDGTVTKGEFLKALSDDPAYADASIFRRAATSMRKTDVQNSMPALVTKQLRKDGAGNAAAGNAAAARSTRIGQLVANFIERLRRTPQDAYRTHFKAFDKIAIVRGAAWARTHGEQVVSLLHAVTPPELFKPVGNDPAFLHVEDQPSSSTYKALVAKDAALFDALCSVAGLKTSAIEAPVSSLSFKAARIRVVELVSMVGTLSDHLPCITEYRVALPADYPRAASVSGSPVPVPVAVAASSSGKGDQGIVDGRRGLLTRAFDYRALADVGRIRRLACLAQGMPSCGVRAVWNAQQCRQLSANQANADPLMVDHDALVASLAVRGGLPQNVWGEEVARLIEVRAPEVIYIGHFRELIFLAENAANLAPWRALNAVAHAVPNARSLLIINTFGEQAVEHGQVGHFIVVHLEVRADRSLDVTYVDSLEEGADRAKLITDLVAALHAWRTPLAPLPPQRA